MGRDFRLLVSANLISLCGDWILRTGLAYQVYALTGSTLASAGAVLAGLIPQIALGSVAGVFADRWDRRRTMVVTNLLLGLALLPLLAVRHAAQLWIVLVVMAVSSALAPFFGAAEASTVPALVPADRLVRANALNNQAGMVARLIGAGLGGVVAGAGGIPVLAIVDTLTFALAAGLLWRLRPVVTDAAADTHHPVRDWIGGLRLIGRTPALRVVLAFMLITGVGEALMGTLMAPFVRDVLHGSATAYGSILSAQAVGGIAGGAVAAAIGHRFAPRTLFGWGAIVFGALDLALFLYPLIRPVLWPAWALMVVIGLPGALLVAGALTVVQTATAPAFRGRVFGTILTMQGVAEMLGTTLAGTLPAHLGIVGVLAAQGAGYAVAGLLVLIALRPPEPAMNESVAVVHDLVRRVPAADPRDRSETLAWLESTDDVFRRVKPDTPAKHLVSYVVPIDPATGDILLVAHRNAGLWLPPGGHVDPGEHPAATAARELHEELGLTTGAAGSPVFLSVTVTVGLDSGHTDVSLWFPASVSRDTPLTPDAGEFSEVRWWSRADLQSADASAFDPRMPHFLAALS